MQNCGGFHSQLTSIMDILCKAAVAEISKLVEDSYCAMRLEIHRSRSDNEGLKRRLRWLERELVTARGGAPRGSEPGERAHVPVCEVDAEDFPPLEQQQPELESKMRPGSVRGVTQHEAFEDTLEPQSTECSDGGLGVLQFVVKPEHDETLLVQSLSPSESEHDRSGLKSLSLEYPGQERSNQLWTSFTQEDSDIDTDYLDCSHAAETYSRLSAHTESQAVPARVEGSLNSLSSLRMSCDPTFSTVTVKEEMEVNCQASKSASTIAHAKREQFGGKAESRQKGNSQMEKQRRTDRNAQRSSMDIIQNDNKCHSAKKGKPQKAGSGKKWFICTHCGKSLAYFSCYKVHLRSHTGEKPYRCLQCGKSFTQQSNLTKHESVHSGKKPFGCSQCGKSFRHRYNLTLHQRVHSGEKPFHCTLCGKSFAQSCHFKRHQLCHEADKSYS
ncbi:oocyte zinc finger protein XlCOF7.1-like [Scleropages formosus]|uniref:Oocyte zinc finger protein XlCOF7.1-like n=1 Tax=Scleropages formosus TaxID=113540 RepID=A0A8D0CLM0_SCLFO|nr:oocyte zinc finger protein XlCOF7.1-like [Scleropages formosus]